MTEDNYYALLGVAPVATPGEIKKAYRKRARECHPDSAGPESSEEMFQKIREAYGVLSDAERRRVYDLKNGYYDFTGDRLKRYTAHQAHGSAPLDERERWDALRQQVEGASEFAGPSAVKFSPLDKEEEEIDEDVDKAPTFFSRLKEGAQILSGKSGIHKILGGRGGPQTPEARHYRFTIDSLEALHGTFREVAVGDPKTPRLIRIKIPAGIQPGSTLKVNAASAQNEREQIILVKVDIIPHPLVEVEGNDIIVKIPITIGEAINGAEVDIPTLEGPTRVKLPPQTREPKRLRLSGRGLKNTAALMRGDLYVKPYIVMPEAITPAGQEAAKALDAHYQSDVRRDLPKSL